MLIVVAVIAAVALIGGGIWAFTRDDGNDEVASQDDDRDRDEDEGEEDEEDDDGEDAEPLDEAAARANFLDAADVICTDLRYNLQDIPISYFGDVSAEEIRNAGSDVHEAFRDEIYTAVGENFGKFRDLHHPDPASDENWARLVDEWESVYEETIEFILSGSGNIPGRLAYRSDVVIEHAGDFGLTCFQQPLDPPISSPPSAGEAGGSSEAGAPLSPPVFIDQSMNDLGDACYWGDMEACDSLYLRSAIDSPEEVYGDTCGGRTSGGTACVDIENPLIP